MKISCRECWLVAVAAAVAFLGMSVRAVDPAKPGRVKVEWSEADGETWTVEGLADCESGRPMSKDTVFAICSNTKPITSVLVLTVNGKAVEKKRIELAIGEEKLVAFATDVKPTDKVDVKVR